MNIPLLIVILYVLLLFGISIYVSYSQKKDSENFLLYKGKNNAFVVAASIAGLAIGGASTIGIAENAFTVGLSAGWYDTAWRRLARLFLLCWQSVTCVEASTRPSAVL